MGPDFKYIERLMHKQENNEIDDRQTDEWMIDITAPAVLWMWVPAMVERGLRQKMKLSIYWAIY